jgi:hypothetical protein
MLHVLLLAKDSLKGAAAPTGKGLSMEWGIVLIGVILGLTLTLMPPKRTSEIKKEKEE